MPLFNIDFRATLESMVAQVRLTTWCDLCVDQCLTVFILFSYFYQFLHFKTYGFSLASNLTEDKRMVTICKSVPRSWHSMLKASTPAVIRIYIFSDVFRWSIREWDTLASFSLTLHIDGVINNVIVCFRNTAHTVTTCFPLQPVQYIKFENINTEFSGVTNTLSGPVVSSLRLLFSILREKGRNKVWIFQFIPMMNGGKLRQPSSRVCSK